MAKGSLLGDLTGSDDTMNRGIAFAPVLARTRNLCCRRHSGLVSNRHWPASSDRASGDRFHNFSIDGRTT
jgi:hypothetical protein